MKKVYIIPQIKAVELESSVAMIVINSLGEYEWPWDYSIKEETDFEFKKKNYNLFDEKQDIWTQEWKE